MTLTATEDFYTVGGAVTGLVKQNKIHRKSEGWRF